MKQIVILQGQEFISRRHIREMFGVGQTTIHRWGLRGLLPMPIRLGRALYYAKADLEARLAQNQRAPETIKGTERV